MCYGFIYTYVDDDDVENVENVENVDNDDDDNVDNVDNVDIVDNDNKVSNRTLGPSFFCHKKSTLYPTFSTPTVKSRRIAAASASKKQVAWIHSLRYTI